MSSRRAALVLARVGAGIVALAACTPRAGAPAPDTSAPEGADMLPPRSPPLEASVASSARASDGAPSPSDAGPNDRDASPANDATVVADAPPDMLLVPAGPFSMGADSGGEADERPAHVVTLAAFYLDRTEVTNAAYDACVAASEKACRQKDLTIASRSHAGPDKGFQRPQQPVVGVAWSDARAYCAWAGKRLPREAEFEKAVRGAEGRKYAWGDEKPSPERAVYGRSFGRDTTDDVGSHPSGRGPYGHDDLAGNVWEWVEDEYDPMAYTRATASEGLPGSCREIMATLADLRARGAQGFTGSNPIPNECERVLRGGAFNYDGPGLRGSNRVHHPGRFRLVMSGFRCAKSLSPEDAGSR